MDDKTKKQVGIGLGALAIVGLGVALISSAKKDTSKQCDPGYHYDETLQACVLDNVEIPEPPEDWLTKMPELTAENIINDGIVRDLGTGYYKGPLSAYSGSNIWVYNPTTGEYEVAGGSELRSNIKDPEYYQQYWQTLIELAMEDIEFAPGGSWPRFFSDPSIGELPFIKALGAGIGPAIDVETGSIANTYTPANTEAFLYMRDVLKYSYDQMYTYSTHGHVKGCIPRLASLYPPDADLNPYEWVTAQVPCPVSEYDWAIFIANGKWVHGFPYKQRYPYFRIPGARSYFTHRGLYTGWHDTNHAEGSALKIQFKDESGKLNSRFVTPAEFISEFAGMNYLERAANINEVVWRVQ